MPSPSRVRAANSAVTSDKQVPPTEIGSNCIIGTNVVIYRGCTIGQKVLVADLSTMLVKAGVNHNQSV